MIVPQEWRMENQMNIELGIETAMRVYMYKYINRRLSKIWSKLLVCMSPNSLGMPMQPDHGYALSPDP